MKKLFNNSTKGNETQSQSSKSKRKFLKTFSFTSLALLMGIAGTMAFAPLGASPSVANASEMVDQINTKADGKNIKYAPSALGLDPENDPVIYTTESGLEIKYGGESVSDQLASGKPLSGYPYFTMGTYNGYAVNWVIIGRNTNDTVFTSAISAHLFSTWKTNNSASSATFENKGYYFFKNTYESTTPAGSAINGVVPSKSYVSDVTKATKTVVGTEEIPSGCVLAISEQTLGGTALHHTEDQSIWEGNRYRYKADQSTTNTGVALTHTYNQKYDGYLYTYNKNLYNTNLNLSTSQKKLIIPQKLNTYYFVNQKSYLDTYDTDGNTLYELFPLAATVAGYNQNFCIDTYLTTNALRVTTSLVGETYHAQYAGLYSLRTGSPDIQNWHAPWSYYVDFGGPISHNGGGFEWKRGVRPAGVFELG